jgi:hypothetical protein
MTLADQLRAEAARLRTKADRLDAAASVLDDDEAPAPTRRVSSARRQSSGGEKPLKTRDLVRRYLAEHPASTASEVAKALRLKPATAAYHLTGLKKK